MKDQASKESKASSRMSYGACDIYGGGAFVVISTFYTVFLTKALGMPPALAGMIPLIGKVWDAVTDPIMGNIADRTVSKFGPKRFWILVGSIISAITVDTLQSRRQHDGTVHLLHADVHALLYRIHHRNGTIQRPAPGHGRRLYGES